MTIAEEMAARTEPAGELRVIFYGSEAHYLDHLVPVAAVTPGARVLCPSQPLLAQATGLLLPHASTVATLGTPRAGPGCPVVVASYRDARRLLGTRPVALLEHGAGQTYADAPDSPHYPGGEGWDHASLILSPGPHAARRWRSRYPSIPVVELGGTPRLDRYVSPMRAAILDMATALGADTVLICGRRYNRTTAAHYEALQDEARVATQPGHAARLHAEAARLLDEATPPPASIATLYERPVGVAFHWQVGTPLCPEQGSGWEYWKGEVEELVRRREVRGHGHPRAWGKLSAWYRYHGIEATPRFTDIVERCGVLVGDNSSVMYEWAALGRPVLCLDAPQYRPDVDHGLRFWNYPPGLRLGPGLRLPEAIDAMERRTLDEKLAERSFQDAAVAEAYGGPWDGRSTERAVAAIEEHLLGSPT